MQISASEAAEPIRPSILVTSSDSLRHTATGGL